jgi:hypothetical protein
MLVVSHKSTVALLEYGESTFHIEGKYPFNKPRLNICVRTGATILERPLIIKVGISSKPTDIDDLRRRTAGLMSPSEKEGAFIKSERVALTGEEELKVGGKWSVKLPQ